MTSSRSSRLRAAAAALFLTSGSLLFACEDLEPPGASRTATAQDVNDLCEAMCGRHERCASEPASTCTPACEDRYAKAADHLRSDLLRALGSCFAHLGCEVSDTDDDDECTKRAQENIGIDHDQALKAPDYQACLAMQKECADTKFDFSDDRCKTLFFMTSSTRTKAAACYKKALCGDAGSCEKHCDEVGPCIAPFEL
jgi:hypothetical protein